MYKVVFFLFCLYTSYVSSHIRKNSRDNVLSEHLERVYNNDNDARFTPLNIRDNIKYERQNNYELYRDADKKLQQQKISVNEPRQILKGNVSDLRYTINDLEIIHNVYPFEPRYEKKILRETLKPASLCFELAGLLLPHLNNIKIENSPLYGFLISGNRNPDNTIVNLFDISAILSNTPYPLGSFKFPFTKELHYQISFLIDYYENSSGYNRKSFSYICPMPKFLVDVFYTTGSGLKFNFNGKEIDAKEMFPITVTYFNDTSSAVPVQVTTPSSENITNATEAIALTGSDVQYRLVTNSGAAGNGLQSPSQRANVSKSFVDMKTALRRLLNRPSTSDFPQEYTPYYFLLLSQRLLRNLNMSYVSRITSLEVSNIQVNSKKMLVSYKLKLFLDNNYTVEVDGRVNNAEIPVPVNVNSSDVIAADVSPAYGFYISHRGLRHVFCSFEEDFQSLFDYKMNKLAEKIIVQ